MALTSEKPMRSVLTFSKARYVIPLTAAPGSPVS